MKDWQKYPAEAFGTFILVFVGATAVVGFGAGAAPFGFGLALLAGLYAFGEISGGHFNPAVSLAMFLDRRLGAADLLRYWVSQFVGAILGALALLLMTSSKSVAQAATVPVRGDRAAFFVELFMTAVFVLVILQVTKSKGFGTTAYLAIPLTLLAIHYAAVPFSGSSVNPARTIATALVGDKWTAIWIYLVAPPLGAVLGWAIHAVVVSGESNLAGRLGLGGGQAST
jgi:aquaporin Z